MDCCENIKHEDSEGSIEYKDNKENMKGGKSMVEVKKNVMLWVVIGLLVIATIFLTVKASSIGAGTAQAAALVASTASSGMVGGC